MLLKSLTDDHGGCGFYQWPLATIWDMEHDNNAGQDPCFHCLNGHYNYETWANLYALYKRFKWDQYKTSDAKLLYILMTYEWNE